MKYWCVLLLLCWLSPQALSQQPPRREDAVLQTPPQQWRAELRSTLQVPREPMPPKADSSPDPQTDDTIKRKQRHLSAQERVDLRQQLQQQRQYDARENRLKAPD